MRALAMLALASCTLGSGARPDPRDPDPMPSAVLAHQDPAADTSKNPVLSRSESHYHDPNDGHGWCAWIPFPPSGCSTGDRNGVLLVAATVAFACRRRRRGGGGWFARR
jgi:hypothetical protein